MSNGASRKWLAAGVVWLAVLALGAAAYKWLIAPGRKQALVRQTASDPRQPHQFRLALDSFSGYCVLRSSAFKQELATRGIGLELLDDGADYSRRLAALQSGEIPLAVFTLDALLKTCADLDDLPGTVVLVIDETTGADAMVAYQQAVPSIDALNRPEARIVATRNSPSEFLARVVTANFQLPRLPADCWIDAQGAADVYRQFREDKPGEPRAYVLWEPYVSKVLQTPGTHVLIDSSKFRGYLVDVLVVQRQFLLQHEPQVRDLLAAYFRATYQVRQSAQGQGLAQLVLEDARGQGETLSAQQAARLVDGIWWKSTLENYGHFGLLPPAESGDLQSLDEMIRGVVAVLLRTGAIEQDPTNGQPNQLYVDRPLKTLQASNFHPSLIPGTATTDQLHATGRPAVLSQDQWSKLVEQGTLRVDALVFARGTATLIQQSQETLDRLAETLARWPQYYLLVRGHARTDGDPEANRQLAAARAQAAVAYLTSHGVAAERVRAAPTEPSGSGGQAQTVTFVLGLPPY